MVQQHPIHIKNSVDPIATTFNTIALHYFCPVNGISRLKRKQKYLTADCTCENMFRLWFSKRGLSFFMHVLCFIMFSFCGEYFVACFVNFSVNKANRRFMDSLPEIKYWCGTTFLFIILVVNCVSVCVCVGVVFLWTRRHKKTKVNWSK